MRRTGRSIARAAFVIGLLGTWPAAAQQWPQFRGGASGVAADDPRLPDTWSATDNVAWSVAVPGRSWSSPVVWGDHVFVVTAVNARQVETLNPVADVSRAIARRADERRGHHAGDRRVPLDAVRRRFPDRPHPLGADDQRGRARPAGAPEELVRVRDAGHRRRARVRVPRLRRALRVRHDGTAGVVEAHGRAEDAHRLGHGGLAGPPRRPPLHRQRQRRPVVHRRLRCAHRRRTVAHGTAGRSVELVFAVRLADRPADRDRDDGDEEGAFVRHQRRAAVGARGHDLDSCGDADCEPRPALRQLGLFSGHAASDLRDPAGRPGRHLARSRGRRATSSSRGRTRRWPPRIPRRSSSAISTTR